MKKLILAFFFTLSAMVVFNTNGFTQSYKGFAVNLGFSKEGYGYPNRLYEQPVAIAIPTINLSGDYSFGIFSIGLYGAYTYNYYKFRDFVYPGSDYKDVWKGWDLGLRYTFHLSPVLIKNDKIDLYAAAFSGYTSREFLYDKNNIYRDSLNFNIHTLSVGGILGGRYFITEHIGLYGEVGLSRDLFLGGGVTYQLPAKKKQVLLNQQHQ